MIRLALLLVTLSCACRGAAEDGGVVDGPWTAEVLAFEVSGGQIEALELHGVGCVGPATAAGEPICSATLDGPTELAAPIDADGRFHLETVFGLVVDGHFMEADRAEGTWSFAAVSGCCTASAPFTARPAAEGGSEATCTPPTGDETLEVGVTAGHGGATPRFATVDQEIAAVPGFQGAIMVVSAVRAGGLGSGPFALDVDVRFPATGVTGHLHAPNAKLEGKTELVSLFVVLEHPEIGTLAPGNADDLALVVGQEVELSATLTSPCGLELAATATAVVTYAP